MPTDLTDADRATLVALLRDTIEADRFPLSPRVRRWAFLVVERLAGRAMRLIDWLADAPIRTRLWLFDWLAGPLPETEEDRISRRSTLPIVIERHRFGIRWRRHDARGRGGC